MALHSKKEFSALCGVATNYLAVAVKRGKVILTGDLVDDTNQTNAAFLQKRSAQLQTASEIVNKSDVKSAKPEKKFPPSDENDDNYVAGSEKNRGNLTYAQLEREKKLADLIKTEADTQKTHLQIQKLTGASIPTVLVKEVVSTLSKSLISSFKDGVDGFLIEISKRKNLTGVELAELRGALVLIINNSSTKAITESKKRIKSIVNEYSDKRDVGEHD